MSLNLRVDVPAQNTTKVMRFTEGMSVHEAAKTIQEKVGFGGKDHGIFLPSPEAESSLSMGKWLKPEKTLEYYDLKQNDTIVYKKKSEIIKIKFVDDSIKSVMVDTSLPLVDVVEFIAQKVGLKNAGEFSLQEESKGQWLKNQLALPEQVPTLEQLFILKKKFFVSDANVNTEDPIELHLIYCQSRDDIVAGAHPCTKEEAIQFAALQAQIQEGNYTPDKHKSGHLNKKEYLAPAWRTTDVEKRMLEEWKKLAGMTEVNARYRYVQLCRSLKTYGMTCFKVREKVPGKKKLFDACLCFTRDSIIRMEYETKRVIKEHPFKHLMRWAASPETFTMDFGSYEEEYVVVVTTEGEAISNLLAGYIDLLLRKQKDTGVVIEEDDSEVATVTDIGRVKGSAPVSITSSSVGGARNRSYTAGVSDINTAMSAIERMKNELYTTDATSESGGLSPEQRRNQINDQAKALQNMTETLETMAKGGNRNAMNGAALKMVQLSEQLALGARQCHAQTSDPNDAIMVDSSRDLCDALKNLLGAANEYSNNPNDPSAREALLRAQQAACAALQKLAAAAKGAVVDDEGFKALFKEMARSLTSEAEEMVSKAKRAQATITDPTKRDQLGSAGNNMKDCVDHLSKLVDILAPTAKDANCKLTIEKAGKAVESAAMFMLATAKASGTDPNTIQSLIDCDKRIAKALENLISITELPDMKGADQSDEFVQSAQLILQSAAALMASEGNPDLIKQQAVVLKNAVSRLGNAGKAIITAHPDPMARERLANYLKGVVEGAKKVISAAQVSSSNPNDKLAHKQLKEASAEISEATQELLSDAGKPVAFAALYNSAKLAAAASTQLIVSSRAAINGHLIDNNAQSQLAEATRATSDALDKLLNVLKQSVNPANENKRRSVYRRSGQLNKQAINPGDSILQGCEQFAPTCLKLVSASKTCSTKIPNPDMKQNLVYASNSTAKALQTMLDNRKALKGLQGQIETAEALEQFKAAISDIDAAILSADTGSLKSTKSRDQALNDFGNAVHDLEESTKRMALVAQNSPEDLSSSMKEVAKCTEKLVISSTQLAGAISDRSIQKGLLNSTKTVAQQMKQLIHVCRAVGSNPDDDKFKSLLNDASKSVSDALNKLREVSTGVAPSSIEDFQKNSSQDIEDLAERELQGAANIIEKCVAKLTAAGDAARQRMSARNIDIDEQNITEAILEACQAIAKSTQVLISSATTVQQEYTKLVKEPKNKTVYKRDPQWAQGLISASRTVAGAVKHLVTCANSAAQGNASEEQLIVAAQSVSAATTQLVTASTVKSANVSSSNQSRLTEAAKKVSSATSSLVNAARAAAQWEEEQQRQDLDNSDDKFNLTDTKIKEMEQQMAILRLEKELERARSGLATMRRREYRDAGTSSSSSSSSTTSSGTTTRSFRSPSGSSSSAPSFNDNGEIVTTRESRSSSYSRPPPPVPSSKPQSTPASSSGPAPAPPARPARPGALPPSTTSVQSQPTSSSSPVKSAPPPQPARPTRPGAPASSSSSGGVNWKTGPTAYVRR